MNIDSVCSPLRTQRARRFLRVKPPTPLMISTAVVTIGTKRQPNKKPDPLGFP